MTIVMINKKLILLSNGRLDSIKLTSILHRIKKQDAPNEKLFKGVKKICPDLNEVEIENLKDFIETINFNKIGSFGRGSDKRTRKEHGSMKAKRFEQSFKVDKRNIKNKEAHENYWNEQSMYGHGASWVTPPN